MTKQRLYKIADAVEGVYLKVDRVAMATELRKFADRLELERRADEMAAAHRAADFI